MGMLHRDAMTFTIHSVREPGSHRVMSNISMMGFWYSLGEAQYYFGNYAILNNVLHQEKAKYVQNGQIGELLESAHYLHEGAGKRRVSSKFSIARKEGRI